MFEGKEFDLADAFLSIYLVQLEISLKDSKELTEIKFQSEEANTDEFVKKFFQTYMQKYRTIDIDKYKSVVFDFFKPKQVFDIKDISQVKIIEVYIPEELPSEIVEKIVEEKESVYTNPDLMVVLSDGESKYYKSIELKSTKNNLIPGSSVQQVAPFEWVIFLKRNKSSTEIATGLYIESLASKLPFPDRSPRPIIGFNNLTDYNRDYRKIESGALVMSTDEEDLNDKLILINDWREFLADEWIEVITQTNTKTNEKWFNFVIRRFALKLLKYFASLDDSKRNQIIANLEKNTKT
ncbi:MAG: hypothetical protein RLN90_08665 [Balneolaceae bacterium]